MPAKPVFKSINSIQQQNSLSGAHDQQNRVNMFYLKDTLVGKTQNKPSLLDKMRAIAKMRNF